MRASRLPLILTALALWPATSHGAQGDPRWHHPPAQVVVGKSALALAGAGAVRGAFETWTREAGLAPVVVQAGVLSQVGYVLDGENQCGIYYAKRGTALAKGALAVTVTTYDQRSGEILDADIVLNGIYDFGRAEDSERLFDVQNVLTHEVGHFYGLSDDAEHVHATMWAKSRRGETSKRTLSDEDVEAISALYSTDDLEPGAGCSLGAAGSAGGGWSGLLLLSLLGLVGRRKRFVSFAAAGAVSLGFAGSAPAAALPIVADVVAASSHFEDGLIVSELELNFAASCAGCPRSATVRILGGAVDGIAQRVGHSDPPLLGDRVELSDLSPTPTVQRVTARP